MAKRSKSKDKETEAPASTVQEAPKYGVNELAEALDIEPASVRVGLRALGVEKTHGNRYGWDTKKDFEVVVKQMKERSANRPDMSAGDDEKPSKKGKAKAKAAAKPRRRSKKNVEEAAEE